MKLTSNENKLVLSLEGYTIEEIERVSEKEFDLKIKGHNLSLNCSYSAWLPLAVIRNNDWIDLAAMSDYPEMVKAGDWSGIRDSSKENIWKMFEMVKTLNH
jgi:hypothetical protein